MKLSAPKAILHVITSVAPGGAEKHLLSLAQQQVNDGLRVRVVSLLGVESPLQAAFEKCGVSVISLGLRWYGQWGPVKQLRLVLADFQPDLIHAHLPPAELYVRLALLDRDYSKVPLIISKHNDERFAPIFFEKSLSCWVAKRAQKVICISHAVEKYWSERNVPSDPTQACVVHYGVDATSSGEGKELRRLWGVDSSVVLFGFVGRLVPQKALGNLLTAFTQLEHPDARLVLVGDGPLKGCLERQVQSAGMLERVRFTGFREDIPSVMSAVDVLVLGSDYEGFGLVLLEAMAAGKPVLATYVSAIPEVVVDGETGILVPPRNPQAMATGMDALMDSSKRQRMGQAAAVRVREKFCLKRMVQQTQRIYDRVLNSCAA